MKTLQFVLTGFADRSTSLYQRESRHERTYFVKYVVPILQRFGQQTGCLDFQWCEVHLQQCSRMDMNVGLWTSPALRYVDGLGYDMYGEERLIIEASSNQHKECLQHMLDDTVKQLYSSIYMLQGIANTYSDTNFITMRKVKIFGLQCVRTGITFSQTSFDENGKYMYEEIRSVKLPTSYDERTRLIRVMDLLAYLLIEINEQEQTVNTLRDEHDGRVEVDEKYLVKAVFYNE